MNSRSSRTETNGSSGPAAVRINGSYGEGGGALFRTVLALSALTQRPVQIDRIRGGLRKPGLNAEDLAFLKLVCDCTLTEMPEVNLGDDTLLLAPRRLPKGTTTSVDVGTFEKGSPSGSACVLLAGIAPVLGRALGYSELHLVGETHGANMISFDAMERSLFAAWRRMGLVSIPVLKRAGFGAGNHGEILADIEPGRIEGVHWAKRGSDIRLGATVTYGELEDGIAERAQARLEAQLQKYGENVDVEIVQVATREPGIHVTVYADCQPGFGSAQAAGRRGTRIEHVVDQAMAGFAEWYESDATVDMFLADQLLLPAVLSVGDSTFTTPQITRRLQTMAWAIKQFIPIPITIRGTEGGPGTITIQRGSG
ncbi:MAG: RNA 3'-terminal phosphate cyclase [Armatimonadota bacterium]|nr:hypothetical protein [Fimbriimonadaceae bacterium]